MNAPSHHDDALSLLALGLEPVPPPAWVRETLLRRVTTTARYAPFIGALGRMFDLPRARMAELLQAASRPDAWAHELVPGLRIIHFAAGPSIVGRHAGLALVREGFEFPQHRHLVEEHTFVLEGLLIESDGTMHGPGDVLVRPPGTRHAVTVLARSVLASLVGPVDSP